MTSSYTSEETIRRFTPDDPCPVCAGHQLMEHGQGIRCAGFYSRDETSVFCTREEYARGLAVNEKTMPPSYRHQLMGTCGCGVVDHAVEGAAPHAQGNGHSSKTTVPIWKQPGYRLESDEPFPIEFPDGTLAGWHVRLDYSFPGPDGTRVRDKQYLWKALHGRKVKDLPLFRVYELMREPHGSRVYVTEGERDCEAVNFEGLNAVGTVTGAGGTPCDESLRPLLDYQVAMWADADDVGRAHMHRIAARLVELGAHVLWVNWPESPDGGGAADYFKDTGHTPETLAALVQPWQAPAGGTAADGRVRQVILTSNRPMRDLVAAAKAAVEGWDAQQGDDLHRLYLRNGELSRVWKRETGSVRLELLTDPAVQLELSYAADFLSVAPRGRPKKTADGDDDEDSEDGKQKAPHHVYPPVTVVRALMTVREWNLPELRGVSSAPIVRPDGTIFSDADRYDVVTQRFYCPPPGFVLPPVPERPTRRDVHRALRTLIEPFRDFPLVGRSAKAHVLALILTPFLRAVIEDVTPPAAITAPKMATGKGLLGDAAMLLATGERVSSITRPASEDEWEKQLNTLLLAGAPVIHIDNVDGVLKSEALEGILTRRYGTRRMLKTLSSADVVNDATWLINGNNTQLIGGLARRHYRIRLDTAMARPWDRKRSTFHHPDLLAYIEEERPDLVVAALTLIRYWFTHGCTKPPEDCFLASFTRWSDVVGGILWQAGVRHFLADRDEAIEEADPTVGEWEARLVALHEATDGQPFRASEVFLKHIADYSEMQFASSEHFFKEGGEVMDLLPSALQPFIRDRGKFSKQLGDMLRSRKNTVIGTIRVLEVKKDERKGNLWKLALAPDM